MMPISVRLPAMLLPLLVATTHGQVTETLFDALIPSACVTSRLNPAGFCSVQNKCAYRCFGQDTSGSSASMFSLDSAGLANFYIPGEARDCEAFEDPICPATRCCPQCKDELNALYRCIINEGNYDDIPFQVKNYCALDCKTYTPPVPPVITPTDPPVITQPDSNTTDVVVSRTDPPITIDTDVDMDYNETDWNETDWNETDLEDEVDGIVDLADAEDETAEAASNLIQAMAAAP